MITQPDHMLSRALAYATGLPGPDVLDVDQHGDAGNGFTACQRLDAARLLDGTGAVVATPGGGLHLYFAGSRQRSGRLRRHHLDFRAAGGSPSHVNGTAYRLIRHGPSLGRVEWPAVTGMLEPEPSRPGRPPGAAIADPSRLAAWVEQLEEGNRNCGLFWTACRAGEAGQHDLFDELAAAAARTGLPEREISLTIASARRTAQTGRTGRRAP